MDRSSRNFRSQTKYFRINSFRSKKQIQMSFENISWYKLEMESWNIIRRRVEHFFKKFICCGTGT